jgi:hypothetical protein
MRNFLLGLTIATILAGCGGDTYVKVQGTTNISKGQELADLQRALDQDAISKKDYDRVRSKILERPQ